jgi:hypothetical protein
MSTIEKYTRWFEVGADGSTPLDLYQKEPNKCPFSDNTFSGDYNHTLHHLLNHFTHELDTEKVKLLLTKYKADPNATDINCYNGQALFITVFETYRGYNRLGALRSSEGPDEANAELILQQFIRSGASYNNRLKCYPFDRFGSSGEHIKMRADITEYVRDHFLLTDVN